MIVSGLGKPGQIFVGGPGPPPPTPRRPPPPDHPPKGKNKGEKSGGPLTGIRPFGPKAKNQKGPAGRIGTEDGRPDRCVACNSSEKVGAHGGGGHNQRPVVPVSVTEPGRVRGSEHQGHGARGGGAPTPNRAALIWGHTASRQIFRGRGVNHTVIREGKRMPVFGPFQRRHIRQAVHHKRWKARMGRRRRVWSAIGNGAAPFSIVGGHAPRRREGPAGPRGERRRARACVPPGRPKRFSRPDIQACPGWREVWKGATAADSSPPMFLAPGRN